MADGFSPELIAKLERLGIVAGTTASSMDASVKTIRDTIKQRVEEKKSFDDLVKNIRLLTNVSKDEAKQIAEKIKVEEAAAAKKAIADKAQLEAADKNVERLKEATQKIGALASSAISAGQSIYHSDKAFSAVTPTLELIGSTVTSVISALGKLGSGISFAGFSFGKSTEAISDMVNVGVNLAVQVTKNNIENAQHFVDTYDAMSKVGVSFGGSITRMAESAVNAGLSVETYSKFILSSVESLSAMGGGLEGAAASAARVGKDLAITDKKLLTMYGGFDKLNGVVADYMAQQARYGDTGRRSQAELIAGASEYAYHLKELSNLTGKSEDRLKKEEEERSKKAAWQFAMASMNEEQQANARMAINLAEMQGGEALKNLVMQSIATQGQAWDKQSNLARAAMPAMAQWAETMAAGVRSTKENFQANAIASTQDSELRDREIESRRGAAINFAQMGYAGSEILAIQSQMTASGISARGKMKNLEQAFKDAADPASPTDSMSGMAAGLKTQLETIKKEMDAEVKATFARTAKLVSNLYEVQKEINKLFSSEGALQKGLTLFIDGIKKAYEKLLEYNKDKVVITAKEVILIYNKDPNNPDNLSPEALKLIEQGASATRMSYNSGGGGSGGGGGDAMGPQFMRMATEYAMQKAVKYSWGGGRTAGWSIDNAGSGIDCSGWVSYLNRSMMQAINKESGKEVYGEQARKLFAQAGTAGTIIDSVVKATGFEIKGAANKIDPNRLSAGMMIGSKNKNWSGANVNPYEQGLQHIAQITEGPGGQLLVSESTGGGVRQTPLSNWLKEQAPGTELSITDPTRLASGDTRGSGGSMGDFQTVNLLDDIRRGIDAMNGRLEKIYQVNA